MEDNLTMETETYAIESLSSVGKSGSDTKQHSQPADPDCIKLFIGQIPRSMNEDELLDLFGVYGPINQIIILKDQNTNENKGCAFLTFCRRKSAIEAQNALHGVKSLPGMKNPMQVKPANSELRSEEERRLFIGMIPKMMSDNELTVLFAPYGALEDCVILKDRDGQSKGCAFVTYATKKSAQLATKNLHHSKTLEGCRMPLVVKPADTQKDKEVKMRQTKKTTNGGQNSSYLTQGLGGGGGLGSSYGIASQLQQILGSNSGELYGQQSRPNMAPVGGYGGPPPSFNAGGNARYPPPPGPNMMQYPTAGLGVGQGMVNQNPGGIQDLTAALSAIASNPVLNTLLNPNMALLQQLTSMNSAPAMVGGVGGGMGQSGASLQTGGLYGSQQQQQWSSSMRSSSRSHFSNYGKGHAEGPEGCNLFIYHIPEEYGDSDITQIFAPFGNIVSSRVFIDKKTNISKGFGFVSYDNPLSAKNAIQAMNGFQIGSRRLKVELKKPRSESKPY